MVFQYSIDDIKVFVDGVEIVDLVEIGITPKGNQDSVSPIKDWAGKTIGYSVKKDTDCEGSITVRASSASVAHMLSLASSKKQVQVVIAAENTEAVKFKKIIANDCIFFYPEFKPTADEANAEFKFVGIDFKIEA